MKNIRFKVYKCVNTFLGNVKTFKNFKGENVNKTLLFKKKFLRYFIKRNKPEETEKQNNFFFRLYKGERKNKNRLM